LLHKQERRKEGKKQGGKKQGGSGTMVEQGTIEISSHQSGDIVTIGEENARTKKILDSSLLRRREKCLDDIRRS